MRPSRLATLLLLAVLSGCGSLSGEPPPPASATGISQSSLQSGRFIAFVGPHREHAPPFLGVQDTNFWTLRSWLDSRSGESVHQLYVEDSYFGAERNWNAAHTAQGQALKFVPISKNEITCDNGCSYAEEFGAELPEALLRASSQGLAVIFTAKSGAEKRIEVPGDLIEKQLAAVDRARAARRVAAR